MKSTKEIIELVNNEVSRREKINSEFCKTIEELVKENGNEVKFFDFEYHESELGSNIESDTHDKYDIEDEVYGNEIFVDASASLDKAIVLAIRFDEKRGLLFDLWDNTNDTLFIDEKRSSVYFDAVDMLRYVCERLEFLSSREE